MVDKNLSLQDLNVMPIEVRANAVKNDLSLSMWKHENEILAEFHYNYKILEKATVAQMVSHYQALLLDAITNPRKQVYNLRLMTDIEQLKILREWSSTYSTVEKGGSIHEFFERQAKKTPHATAVAFKSQSLTYRELDERANQLSTYLLKLGVGSEVLVGVCVERSIEMVVCLLSILKAGGAYVPIDPNYPETRISHIIDDAAISIVLTSKTYSEKYFAKLPYVICIDQVDYNRFMDMDVEPVSKVGVPSSLAYVIYTSGSTGQPKGVAIEHKSVVELIKWSLDTFSRSELKVVMAATSICFDLSVFEIFVTLSAGGKVYLVSDILDFESYSYNSDITLINTVPSVMLELVRHSAIPASVTTINLAGEQLPTNLVRQLQQWNPAVKINNLYGPSEDTTYSTCAHIANSEEISIGRPITNTEAYILDSCLHLVPVGVVGELHLGGSGLARGYLNNPKLTGERFVMNPFSGDGERLYKTGDLAAWLPDGRIVFLGRIDNQVKIRGYRVEIGEVEDALTRFAGIEAAVVMPVEDLSKVNETLVAYIVGRDRYRRKRVEGIS